MDVRALLNTARAPAAFPEGMRIHRLDNSGALEDTVATALAWLYPPDGVWDMVDISVTYPPAYCVPRARTL